MPTDGIIIQKVKKDGVINSGYSTQISQEKTNQKALWTLSSFDQSIEQCKWKFQYANHIKFAFINWTFICWGPQTHFIHY